jgi:hypothetical protein
MHDGRASFDTPVSALLTTVLTNEGLLQSFENNGGGDTSTHGSVNCSRDASHMLHT